MCCPSWGQPNYTFCRVLSRTLWMPDYYFVLLHVCYLSDLQTSSHSIKWLLNSKRHSFFFALVQVLFNPTIGSLFSGLQMWPHTMYLGTQHHVQFSAVMLGKMKCFKALNNIYTTRPCSSRSITCWATRIVLFRSKGKLCDGDTRAALDKETEKIYIQQNGAQFVCSWPRLALPGMITEYRADVNKCPGLLNEPKAVFIALTVQCCNQPEGTILPKCEWLIPEVL